MDLAKIRKKYRQPALEEPAVGFQPKIQMAVAPEPISESTSVVSVIPEILLTNPVKPENIQHSTSIKVQPSVVYRNPIEAILAGRAAAGCSEEKSEDEDSSRSDLEASLEYLCFRVSDEIYGINIMDIKEITKPREVTEIPRAPEFVSGIISLRGTIIPIIDMRTRLGLLRENITGKERVVVIKNNQSFSGLLVDEVIQVVRIGKESMEPAPSVLEGIDRDFVSGIGRSDGRLIIILNLESIADIHLY
jgi:purine-binding chemotaxis protein CheW